MDNRNNEKNWYSIVTNECLSYPIPTDAKICLDVGCNVGGFVTAWKDHIEKFYCVDAGSSNVSEIKHNTKDFENEITIIHKAVHSNSNEKLSLRPYLGDNQKPVNSGSYGTTEFVYDNNNHGWRTDTSADFEVVDTISLEDLLTDAKKQMNVSEIDLMKVDIEGAEYDFLMNKDLSSVKYIVMEFHNFLSKMESEIDGKNRSEVLHDYISKTHIMQINNGNGIDDHFVRLYERREK